MTKLYTAEQARALGTLISHRAASSGRWPASRKRALLAAIDCGAISLDIALSEYGASAPEIAEWRRGILQRCDVQPDRAERSRRDARA